MKSLQQVLNTYHSKGFKKLVTSLETGNLNAKPM